jgi:hypothetical protein
MVGADIGAHILRLTVVPDVAAVFGQTQAFLRLR